MSSSNGHILIVDDVLDNLRLLRAMLAEHGFETRGVPNGTTALRAVRAHPPDLILLDINMPDLSGYEVCEILKADERTREIPIIFISAVDGVLDKVKAFEVGGVDYITKPFQLQEVLARVENHLTLQQLQQQLRQANETLEQRVAERTAELAEAKEHAEEMSRLKSAFLANMSHEFRTPLAGIIGFTTLMADEASDEQREFIHLIEQSGQRLLNTLNAILDLSMLEAGSMEADHEVLDVAEEVRRKVALLRPLAKEKGLALKVHTPAEVVPALLDRSLLERILNNLVDNAIKFTEQGEVIVEVQPVDGQVEIRVRDTGIGIGADFLPGLFEAFRQESTGAGRLYEGTGLGLTITKKLLDFLGGTITVESKKDRGSTFTVSFPLRVATIAPRVPAPPAHEPAPGERLRASVRALALDDNEAMLYLLERYLEDYDVEVDTAMDEETTLTLARQHQYDVVLLDINLGHPRDGVDVMRKLRTLPGYQRVPMLAVTAYAMPGDRERFLAAGFDEYLGKPFTQEQLHKMLNQVLSSQDSKTPGRVRTEH